jgi:signal transduction histidine kinase
MLTYTTGKSFTASVILAVKDLYVNILINKVLHITKRDLKYSDTDTLISQQIIMLLNAILNQNYFHHCNKLFKPNKGVGTGSYVADIIGKIFIQYYNVYNYVYIQIYMQSKTQQFVR